MPVYEFECKACGRVLDLLVRWGDKKKPRCACGSSKLKKGFSAPSIIMKGGSSRSMAPSSSASKKGCSKGSCSGCGGHCH